jgi:hypothetical protein
LDGKHSEIKELTVGMAVFGRDSSYDPKTDPIVRVEARRLRARLKEYYSAEGRNDSVLIHLPKGGYLPQFTVKDEVIRYIEGASSRIEAAPTLQNWRLTSWAIIGLSVVLLSVSLTLILRPSWKTGTSSTVSRFWKNFFGTGDKILIVPSDSALVLLQNFTERPVTLSDYANGSYRVGLTPVSALPPERLFDFASRQYTQLSHVIFALKIGRLPEAQKANLQVCFARNLTMDDLRSNTTILLGGIQGNPWVGLFEKRMNFRIHFDWRARKHTILNRAPQDGEPSQYAAPLDDPHRTFAIVAFLENLSSQGKVLIVEGSSSAGNEAASRFLFDGPQFGEILSRLTPHGADVPHFEMLLETTNVGNTPSQAQVLASRTYR